MCSCYGRVEAIVLRGSTARSFATNFNLGKSYEYRYFSLQVKYEKQCNEYTKTCV
jgi:hypothetical protein